jgi:ABC-type Fe3+-citrate transport system substrate-binding protein
MNRILTVSMALAACLLASCAGTKSKSKSAYSTTYEPKVTQPTNRSAVKVKISTTAQRVYVMEGDKVLLASPCSVGKLSVPMAGCALAAL